MRAARPRPRADRVHALGCRCASCDPHRAAAHLRALNHWARLTLAGLALGLAAAWLLDRAIGGPGILIIFGVGS
ncbi:MAG: hypothetical protein BGP16_05430 [Sphingobium sp. 66-54]|nr:MAG: hypothetical protein BGP16_05430 [Sphingobium sp. 66-54]